MKFRLWKNQHGTECMIHLKQSLILILGIPVAPEGRHRDFSLFGDQYSNFNAGKILLILEGIGGLHYSTTDDSFTFAENLPKEWSFMEFQVPVQKPNEGKVIFISVLSRQQNDSPEKSVS